MATNTTASDTRTKRKRNQVTYNVDNYFDDMELDVPEVDDGVESDEDGSFGKHGEGNKRAKKKAKTGSKKPSKPKKEQVFRFLDLPAELQNHIYELALTDPDGIALVARTKDYRRSVTRGVITTEVEPSYYGRKRKLGVGWWARYQAQRRDGSKDESFGRDVSRQLVPNLLAVNSQVRKEASSILYKQEIIVEDTTTLHFFIAQIGPYNQKLLSDITVKGWGKGRGVHKGHNFAALTILASCSNLESLFLDCSLGYHLDPVRLARQIFRDGHYFMEAFGAANGKYDAALDVLELADWHFAKRRGNGYHWADSQSQEREFDPKKKEQFEDELRSLLSR